MCTQECACRYGFHGTSHQFLAQQAARMLGKPVEQLNAISCHLGAGTSAAAAAPRGSSSRAGEVARSPHVLQGHKARTGVQARAVMLATCGAVRLFWALPAGAGSSVAAIQGGRSVDTSMGMTPLEGCVPLRGSAGCHASAGPGAVVVCSMRLPFLPGCVLRRCQREGVGCAQAAHG